MEESIPSVGLLDSHIAANSEGAYSQERDKEYECPLYKTINDAMQKDIDEIGETHR